MKVFNYTLMILGMLLLLAFAGIPLESNILSSFGLGIDFFNLTTSTGWNFLFGAAGILILGLGAALVVGFITKSQTENYVLLPFIVSILIVFAGAFKSIIDYTLTIGGWVSGLTILILAPISIGYVISLAEFFRGTD